MTPVAATLRAGGGSGNGSLIYQGASGFGINNSTPYLQVEYWSNAGQMLVKC